jgi:hypothetical protein
MLRNISAYIHVCARAPVCLNERLTWIYSDNVNLLGEKIDTIKSNTEPKLDSGK